MPMKKMYTAILFSMIMWLTLIANFSFAQTSPNQWDLRTIVTTGALSNWAADWCDPNGSYVFYEWSPVYFLLYSEALKTDNYWIFNDSIARKYGDIFGGALKIPFSSSVQPKNGTANTPSNKIIVTEARDWIFTIPAWYSIPRTQPAGQLVTLTHYRLLRTTNPMKTYYFTNTLWVVNSHTASANFSPNANWKKACVTYYLGRCGDGVVDVAGGGIVTPEWFKTWHATSLIPAEQCDDGNTIDTDSCTNECKNGGTPQAPTCTTFVVNPTTGNTNTVYDFSCIGTNATSYQISITNNWSALPGTPLIFTGAGPFLNPGFGPMPAGNNVVTCTVYGSTWAWVSCPAQTIQVTGIVTGIQNTTLQISKEVVLNPLVPDGKYHQGDVVTFKISFANIGANAASNVRIRDVFPDSLIYLATGDQFVGVLPPYNHGAYNNGQNLVVEYSGFYLPAGASWYMIVKWVYKWHAWAVFNHNHAFAEASNADIQNAHAVFDSAAPNANVTITKTLTSFWPFYPGATVWFIITIQNFGDSLNNLQIQDVRPNSSCVVPSGTYTSNIPVGQLQYNGNYSRTLNGSFNQGQTITINMTGQIGNDPVCAAVGNLTNIGNYSYVLEGITHTWSASVLIPVTATPYANIDFQKTIVQAGSNRGETVTYKLSYKNNGTNALSNFVVNDFRPATLNYVSASPLPFNPPLWNSCANGCIITWYINGVLQAGEMGEIILTGTIK